MMAILDIIQFFLDLSFKDRQTWVAFQCNTSSFFYHMPLDDLAGFVDQEGGFFFGVGTAAEPSVPVSSAGLFCSP